MESKVELYVKLSRDMQKVRKFSSELRKQIKEIEATLQEHMIKSGIDTLHTELAEVRLIPRKRVSALTKDTVAESLCEKIADPEKSIVLAEHIISSRKVSVEQRIKPVITSKTVRKPTVTDESTVFDMNHTGVN